MTDKEQNLVDDEILTLMIAEYIVRDEVLHRPVAEYMLGACIKAVDDHHCQNAEYENMMANPVVEPVVEYDEAEPAPEGD
jgi:hypothetical protein